MERWWNLLETVLANGESLLRPMGVSNSMLTDERTSSKEKRDNYTGIRPEQFWGKTTIHGVLIYQYRSPNNPKQMHCNAAQDAVPTHDAMIASSGTGTAGPLMGTMHSP